MSEKNKIIDKIYKMDRPDVDVVYDHENRCVWADNRKYVLKRTDVHFGGRTL